MNEPETWKLVFDGNYEISSHGNFRRATPGRRTHPGYVLKLLTLKIGYHIVNPVIDGKNKVTYIHHLVAEQFIGPCPDEMEINHKDGCKTNNHVSNLEYVTHKENMQHAHKTGLITRREKFTEDQVSQVRSLRNAGLSYSQIVKATGISIATCWNIVNRKASHAGLHQSSVG